MLNLRRFFTLHALKRLVRGLALATAVYALLGFVVIPRVGRPFAEKKLTALLHRQTTIGKIAFNPFTLAVTIDRFAVKDRDGGPFLAFEQLYLDFQALSVIKGGVILRDIVLRAPAVTVVRETPQTYSFSDLLEQFSTPEAPPDPPDSKAKPTRYSLNNIQILGGSIDVVDKPKQATHTVRDINVAVPFLSTLPYDLESYVQPAFAASINGTPLALKGRTKPFSETRETSFDIDFSDLSIPKYMEYVPVALRFTVPAGSASAQVALSFDQHEGRAPDLSVAGHLSVKDLRVIDVAEKPVLAVALLDVTLGKSDIFGGRAVVDKVRLDKPELHVQRSADGKISLAELGPVAAPAVAPAAPAPPVDTPKPAPFIVEVAEAQIVDGTVYFTDGAVSPVFETTLAVAVDAHHVSTEAGKTTAVDVSLHTEAGETIHHAGDVVLEPLRDRGRLDVKGLVLKKYAPYYSAAVLADLDEGTLDVGTKLDLDLSGKAPQVTLSELGVVLENLHLHKRGETRELASVESLEVKDASLDLDKRTLVLGEVSAKKGKVLVERAANGTLNLSTLAPPPKRDAKPVPAAPAPAPAEEPWSVQVTKLALDEWAVRFDDKVPDRPVSLSIDPLTLTVEGFALAKGTRFNVTVRTRVNRGGALSVAGSVVLDPLAASLKIDAKAIDLLPLQPYFTDRINLLLTSGNVSGAGDVTLATAGAGTKVTYKGRAAVDRLVAVDKQTSDDFLRWDSFFLAGIDVSTDPPALTIAEVALTAFYSKLAINSDATLNLRGIVVPTSNAVAADAPAPAAAPAMPVRVAKVTLQGGTVDFSDRLVRPNFSASLREVAGNLSGLSSDAASVADLDLRGKLADAPLEISGKVNPLAKELAVDLKVAFHDIDVSPLSPYSGKYAGYTISKGKLFLDLKYTVADKKLSASNTVFIDQLTLGDPVESPVATKLPVRLALALLKDRRGEIHIDLPLTGTLDDPKFSLGGLILEVVENILVKAVTAPFALLGSLVGHGEELSYLELAEGRSTIDSAGVKKLGELASALADRPALKLDVEGHVDLLRDREGLRRLLFERKLKAEKLKDLTHQGVTGTASVDDLSIDTAEYAHYLELAYRDETFPKPRNVLGMAKDLPPAEMEKLMLTYLNVSDDDLRLLAQRRAQEVKDQLVRGKVDAERIFVVEPKSLAADKKDNLKSSRVDFVLR